MNDLSNDGEKFEKVPVQADKDYNFMVKEKRCVDDFLKKLKDNGSIDKAVKDHTKRSESCSSLRPTKNSQETC